MLLLAGLLLLGLGLGGGVFWGKKKISRLQADFHRDVEALRQRIDVAQRRGTDERMRADQAQRLRYEIEQRLEQSREELGQQEVAADLTQREVESLRNELAGLREQSTRDLATRELKLQQLTEQLAKLEKDYRATVSEYEEAKKQRVVSGQHLDRCRIHNGELAMAAYDLLDAFENKGIFGAMMQSEPLTGIGKIRIEHLIQEYRLKIDQNQLSRKEQ
jgi:chromosome segregation ATPase